MKLAGSSTCSIPMHEYATSKWFSDSSAVSIEAC